jgi:exosome complex component RRP4
MAEASQKETRKVVREIVLPGELLDVGNLKPGVGTYVDDGKIYAAVLGIKNIRANYINIIPLGGRYVPKPGDMVIGKITDIAPANWVVDINSPYLAILHIDAVPWKVEYSDTARYLNVGDAIVAEISAIDDVKRVQLNMKAPGYKKIVGGQIVEISHAKVPRVIGKGGSMINMIKNYTRCRVLVGHNGRIWVDGELDYINIAVRALTMIDASAQVLGLTENIKKFLEISIAEMGLSSKRSD